MQAEDELAWLCGSKVHESARAQRRTLEEMHDRLRLPAKEKCSARLISTLGLANILVW